MSKQDKGVVINVSKDAFGNNNVWRVFNVLIFFFLVFAGASYMTDHRWGWGIFALVVAYFCLDEIKK